MHALDVLPPSPPPQAACLTCSSSQRMVLLLASSSRRSCATACSHAPSFSSADCWARPAWREGGGQWCGRSG